MKSLAYVLITILLLTLVYNAGRAEQTPDPQANQTKNASLRTAWESVKGRTGGFVLLDDDLSSERHKKWALQYLEP